MRKPIYGNVPVAITDEQIAEFRKIYARIRQIKPAHAYPMLCLADTTIEERRFFAAVGDINTYGRSWDEEQAEVKDPDVKRYSDVEEALRELKSSDTVEDLFFKTTLSMDEIEHNFEGVDVFSELKEGLVEANKAADPFFSESNIEFLLRGKAALEAGEGDN